MKPVYCITQRVSGRKICYINGSETIFPYRKEPIPLQEKCISIDEIKAFAVKTEAQFLMFGFRYPGIPARAVEIDSPKSEKAFAAFVKMMNRLPK